MRNKPSVSVYTFVNEHKVDFENATILQKGFLFYQYGTSAEDTEGRSYLEAVGV